MSEKLEPRLVAIEKYLKKIEAGIASQTERIDMWSEAILAQMQKLSPASSNSEDPYS